METIGSLVDKLSINQLKIYHMNEQCTRDDVDESFKDECKARIDILESQRHDLMEELDELYNDIVNEKRQSKVYRQMKMYNEKKYKD